MMCASFTCFMLVIPPIGIDGEPGAPTITLNQHYTPRPETDGERLDTFQLLPPPPWDETDMDRAARGYEKAPVKLNFDGNTGVPTIEYRRKW